MYIASKINFINDIMENIEEYSIIAMRKTYKKIYLKKNAYARVTIYYLEEKKLLP